MPRFKNFVPEGVIPATLLPFADDFSISSSLKRFASAISMRPYFLLHR